MDSGYSSYLIFAVLDYKRLTGIVKSGFLCYPEKEIVMKKQ